MGGKGGGGGGVTPQQMGMVFDADAMGGRGGWEDQATYDAAHPKAADPAPVAAPAAEAPAAAAPEAAAPAADPAPVADNGPPKNDTLTPTIPGGSDTVADPASPFGAGSGTVLGGAVKNPPKYWTADTGRFKGSRSGGTGGSLTTTQT
jgi:hypothetical protein